MYFNYFFSVKAPKHRFEVTIIKANQTVNVGNCSSEAHRGAPTSSPSSAPGSSSHPISSESMPTVTTETSQSSIAHSTPTSSSTVGSSGLPSSESPIQNSSGAASTEGALNHTRGHANSTGHPASTPINETKNSTASTVSASSAAPAG